MENNAKAQTLNRSLGLAECVTTTAGAVIGVGLFTVGSQIVGHGRYGNRRIPYFVRPYSVPVRYVRRNGCRTAVGRWYILFR